MSDALVFLSGVSKPYTVRKWLYDNTCEIKDEASDLLKSYSGIISVELMEDLERLIQCKIYNSHIGKAFLSFEENPYLNGCKVDCFIWPLYQCYTALKKDRDNNMLS